MPASQRMGCLFGSSREVVQTHQRSMLQRASHTGRRTLPGSGALPTTSRLRECRRHQGDNAAQAW